jgi:heparan-alpha-glucosaminide N-acetyltransferase
MTAATPSATLSTGITGETISSRNASIDIFRGLTMAVMIFVNELASVKGLPWWTRHAPADVNVMTYVDMVYPFFLFVLGISMPIAIAQRLKRNPSLLSLWGHVLLRSFQLIVLGYILANAELFAPLIAPINSGTWTFFALLGAALFLNAYPRSERFAVLFRGLRVAGALLTILLLSIFRRTTPGGHIAWLDPSYPEILGLIGFSYLAAAILYIPTRRKVWAPFLWLVLLTALCVVSSAKVIPRLPPIYLWPFDNGCMPSIIMAGVITSWILLGTNLTISPRARMQWGVAFGASLLIAGWLLTPFGISKIHATPSWGLFSSGAAVLLFTALYWLCDVRKQTAWAAPVHAAGANTLLTYLLPDLWYFFFLATGITFFSTHWSASMPGVIKSLAFTALMLYLATLLTRARVRLRL